MADNTLLRKHRRQGILIPISLLVLVPYFSTACTSNGNKAANVGNEFTDEECQRQWLIPDMPIHVLEKGLVLATWLGVPTDEYTVFTHTECAVYTEGAPHTHSNVVTGWYRLEYASFDNITEHQPVSSDSLLIEDIATNFKPAYDGRLLVHIHELPTHQCDASDIFFYPCTLSNKYTLIDAYSGSTTEFTVDSQTVPLPTDDYPYNVTLNERLLRVGISYPSIRDLTSRLINRNPDDLDYPFADVKTQEIDPESGREFTTIFITDLDDDVFLSSYLLPTSPVNAVYPVSNSETVLVTRNGIMLYDNNTLFTSPGTSLPSPSDYELLDETSAINTWDIPMSLIVDWAANYDVSIIYLLNVDDQCVYEYRPSTHIHDLVVCMKDSAEHSTRMGHTRLFIDPAATFYMLGYITDYYLFGSFGSTIIYSASDSQLWDSTVLNSNAPSTTNTYHDIHDYPESERHSQRIDSNGNIWFELVGNLEHLNVREYE